jgi:hypothetical protein
MSEGRGKPLPGFLDSCSERKAKRWHGFVAPDGRVYGPIRNLAAFCREFDLQPNNLRMVAHGVYKSSKGWMAADEFDLMSAIPWEPPKFEYYLESPMGEVWGPVETSSGLRLVAKQSGLPYNQARLLLLGDIEEYRGWTLVALEAA